MCLCIHYSFSGVLSKVRRNGNDIDGYSTCCSRDVYFTWSWKDLLLQSIRINRNHSGFLSFTIWEIWNAYMIMINRMFIPDSWKHKFVSSIFTYPINGNILITPLKYGTILQPYLQMWNIDMLSNMDTFWNTRTTRIGWYYVK